MSERTKGATLLRIQFLEGDLAKAKRKIGELEDANEIANAQLEQRDIETRIDENKQWLRVLEQDPGWGELQEVEGGKYVPRMPTFKTPQEMEYALNNRDLSCRGRGGGRTALHGHS